MGNEQAREKASTSPEKIRESSVLTSKLREKKNVTSESLNVRENRQGLTLKGGGKRYQNNHKGFLVEKGGEPRP